MRPGSCLRMRPLWLRRHLMLPPFGPMFVAKGSQRGIALPHDPGQGGCALPRPKTKLGARKPRGKLLQQRRFRRVLKRPKRSDVAPNVATP